MYLSDDVYTNDADYHNPDNVLNQWTNYHILPMRIEANKLVYHWNETGYLRSTKVLSIPVMEWYSTMGKQRLIKIFESKESHGVYLNRFPNINKERTGDGHENSCDRDKVGCLIQKESEEAVISDMVNAIIYPIDAPLAFKGKLPVFAVGDFKVSLMDMLLNVFPSSAKARVPKNRHAGDSSLRQVHDSPLGRVLAGIFLQ